MAASPPGLLQRETALWARCADPNGQITYTVAAALLGGGPGNRLSDEELARKFYDNHDNAGGPSRRSARPSSRPGRWPFLTLRAPRISPRC